MRLSMRARRCARGSSPVQSGFTLVELLVVISIIGMLISLLLPAVNAARETARQNTCANHQRQLGLAIVQYMGIHGEYPGYVMPQALGENQAATRPISWVFCLLPFLERRDLAERYNGQVPADPGLPEYGPGVLPDQYLSVTVCPSDILASEPGREGLGPKASLSYVANTGLRDRRHERAEAVFKPSPDSPPEMMAGPMDVPRDWAANGIFHFQFPYAGPNSAGLYEPTDEPITHVRPADIVDGVTNTLLLCENVDSGQWTDVLEDSVGFYWQATAAGGKAQPMCCVDECIPCAGCGFWEHLSQPLLAINQDPGGAATHAPSPKPCFHQNYWPYARPSSYHPHGVTVTFADGHVRFLQETVDYLVFCVLMSPHGRRTRSTEDKSKHGGNDGFFATSIYGTAIFAEALLDEDDY
ncbi:MAG: DUF1559 domain-containing protein [Pirellulales bacterium]|nr:DUF1559 domain-containing protein [Pirellulales bacterium]